MITHLSRTVLRRSLWSRAWVALSLMLGLWACERDGAYTTVLDPAHVSAVQGHVAWLLLEQQQVHLFHPDSLKQSRVDLPVEPLSMIAAPEGKGLLIFDESGVSWLPIDASGPGTLVRYPTGTYFSAATFSPERDRVVLHHNQAAQGRGGLLNLNQIAILDLNQGPSAQNPTNRILRAFGQQPSSIIITPKQKIGVADRQLTWALSERYLVLLDLLAPAAPERSAHLTLEGDDRQVRPVQVVPAQGEQGPLAIVRATGSNDLYLFSFEANAPAGEVPRPILNELPAGGDTSSLVTLKSDAGLQIFALSVSQTQLKILDPVTSTLQNVALGGLATELLPFELETEAGVAHYALAWLPGYSLISFIHLDEVAQQRGRAITELRLGQSITALWRLPGLRMALALGADGRSLILLDFESRTATPFSTSARIEAVLIDPHDASIYVGLSTWEDWALREQQPAQLVRLDPRTGVMSSADMEASGQLLQVPESAHLVSVHADTGRLTIFHRDLSQEVQPISRELIFAEGIFDP